MLEWQAVGSEEFINYNGEYTEVKLRYVPEILENSFEVETKNRELDLIAYEEMGTELETLKLLSHNQTILCEYDFDLKLISTLKIPID